MFNKKYDTKTTIIEYHFSDNSIIEGINKKLNEPYFSLEIPIKSIEFIFESLEKKFGKSETIKEYSIYKNNDFILTVYPDGSSYCCKTVSREIKDPIFSSNILVLYTEKYKVSNDNFQCKYIYNSNIDIIDIIFNVNNNINIVLSTLYENNINVKKNSKIKNIESLGKQTKISKSNNAWCELYVSVKCDSNIEEVHEIINSLNLFFPSITTSQT